VNNVAMSEKNAQNTGEMKDPSYQRNLACHRYTDALWYAFENTTAYDNNGGTAQVLESIDRIYYDLFIKNYSMIYGGNNQSAQNSWCWGLEVYDTSIAPQEWVVHSRTADLYREALGTGNLFGDSSKYVTGSHILPAKMDLRNGPSAKDGILISSSGDWNNTDDKERSVQALTTYMGRSGGDGSKQAKYYFAACIWKIDGETKLSGDWWQVRAGGESGGFVGDNQDPYEEQTLGEKDDDPEKNTEYVMRRYLADEDCTDEKVIPTPDGNPNRGFGSDSEVAKRWNFAPLKNSILSQVTDTIRDSVTGGFARLNPFKSDDGEKEEDEEQAKNPENKFGESRNRMGEIPAHDFWQRANGRTNGANFMLAIASLLSISIYGVFVLLSLIPAIFINTIMAILFLAIPFILLVGAIRFVKSKRNK